MLALGAGVLCLAGAVVLVMRARKALPAAGVTEEKHSVAST